MLRPSLTFASKARGKLTQVRGGVTSKAYTPPLYSSTIVVKDYVVEVEGVRGGGGCSHPDYVVFNYVVRDAAPSVLD